MSNPWFDHLKAVRKANPNLSLKEAMMAAKKSYKKLTEPAIAVHKVNKSHKVKKSHKMKKSHKVKKSHKMNKSRKMKKSKKH